MAESRLWPRGPATRGPPAHCHLCSLWASLFGVPARPLTREARECCNCGGRRGVRETVRRAIASANPFLSPALRWVEEPIELEEPA
ncbi:MAG: hypothetical protein QXQ87_03830 [Halobacteria archaeon]